MGCPENQPTVFSKIPSSFSDSLYSVLNHQYFLTNQGFAFCIYWCRWPLGAQHTATSRTFFTNFSPHAVHVENKRHLAISFLFLKCFCFVFMSFWWHPTGELDVSAVSWTNKLWPFQTHWNVYTSFERATNVGIVFDLNKLNIISAIFQTCLHCLRWRNQNRPSHEIIQNRCWRCCLSNNCICFPLVFSESRGSLVYLCSSWQDCLYSCLLFWR